MKKISKLEFIGMNLLFIAAFAAIGHMDNQHKQIKGYRDLSQYEIDMMNEGKELAAKVGEWIEKLKQNEAHDQRCVAIGKTELQTGFMWAIRGIAQPTTF